MRRTHLGITCRVHIHTMSAVFAVPTQPPTSNPMVAFGPNEWLVDELYQQYLPDKNSVDQAWWEFFAD